MNGRGAFEAELRDALEAYWMPPTSADETDTTPLWTPLPGPQTMAFQSEADELGYGGAGGGGKSDLILGLAATAHHSSAIFRTEYAQFRGPEGMLERSKEIVGQRGKLNEVRMEWRGLPGGRGIEFGAVGMPKHLAKWKGRPHDLKAFDEVTEFSEEWYRFLNGWLRTTIIGQRTRTVATFNPPTNSRGQWVIAYWAPWLDPQHPNPATPGELRWFASINGKDVARPNGERFFNGGQATCRHTLDEHQTKCLTCRAEYIRPRSRTFIPARIEDNPYYMRTGYIDVLNNLPEPLRSQLRFGDFQATYTDDPWQVIPTDWIRAAQLRWVDQQPDGPMTALGVDPSRGGADKFCLAPRFGNWVGRVIRHQGKDAPDGQTGAQLIVQALGPHTDTATVNIDVIGSAGSSVFDQARDLHLQAIGLNGSESSAGLDKSGKLRFKNKRAEWHWRMREWLDPQSDNELMLPPDPELLSDLCAPRWKVTPRGIQVEEKKFIKERIGRSPDAGEAVIYACAEDSGGGFGFLQFARQKVAASKAKQTPSAPAEPKESNPWLEALPKDR